MKCLRLTFLTFGLLAALITFSWISACGDDDDDDTYPANSCEYSGCKVVCTYESVPEEEYPTVQIQHDIEDGFVESTTADCNNEGLYRSFEEQGLWEDSDITQVCEPLVGYTDPAGTNIVFSCVSTKFHEEEKN